MRAARQPARPKQLPASGSNPSPPAGPPQLCAARARGLHADPGLAWIPRACAEEPLSGPGTPELSGRACGRVGARACRGRPGWAPAHPRGPAGKEMSRGGGGRERARRAAGPPAAPGWKGFARRCSGKPAQP